VLTAFDVLVSSPVLTPQVHAKTHFCGPLLSVFFVFVFAGQRGVVLKMVLTAFLVLDSSLVLTPQADVQKHIGRITQNLF
jgi:hypothetical protein